MRSSSAVAACVMTVLALGAGPLPARAGEEDGKTLFANARQLRASGKCDEAIVEFRRALEAYPEGLGALRNIAECEEQLGWFAAARRDWWDLRRAVLQTNQPKYEGWDKDAEASYNKLANKVARVTIKLDGGAPDRVRVVFDGKPLDPRLVGVELERDLGGHTAEGHYGGAAPVTQKFTLSEGAREVVTLAIPADAPGDAAMLKRGQTAGAADKTAEPPPSTGVRTAGFVALGVGAVGVAGLVASIVVRQSALGSIDKTCPTHESCPGNLQGAKDRGVIASTLVNVFGAVAIVGLGVGVTLVAVGSTKSHKPTATSKTTAVTLTPTTNGALLGARGAF